MPKNSTTSRAFGNLEIDTVYVFNTKTDHLVKATGRIGKQVCDYPHCSVFIDTDSQLIRVSTPAHNVSVKNTNQAYAICFSYHNESSDKYYNTVASFEVINRD